MNKPQYISLGNGCNSAKMIKDRGLRQASYPFDWILSTPRTVYHFLHMLLGEKQSPEEIVREHFLNLNYITPGGRHGTEHYYTLDSSSRGCLINTEYNLVLPHDGDAQHFLTDFKQRDLIIQKYTRRFTRLKNELMQSDKPMYCLLLTLRSEDYTLNKNIVYDWHEEMTKDLLSIHDLLMSLNNKNRLGLFGRMFKNADINKYKEITSFVDQHSNMFTHEQLEKFFSFNI